MMENAEKENINRENIERKIVHIILIVPRSHPHPQAIELGNILSQ
jgi:hypothetical protein